MLQSLAPFVPATVIGAIILFVIKEVLELRRRRYSDQRKIQAIKHFIARDLELCYWAIASYRNVLAAFQDAEHEPSRNVRIYAEPSGRLHYEHWDTEGDEASFRSGGMFAPVANSFANRFMLDIATLDREIFEHVEKTADDIAELEHIRASCIEQAEHPMHRVGFIRYARHELDRIEASIKTLHKICTGTADIKRRIR